MSVEVSKVAGSAPSFPALGGSGNKCLRLIADSLPQSPRSRDRLYSCAIQWFEIPATYPAVVSRYTPCPFHLWNTYMVIVDLHSDLSSGPGFGNKTFPY